MGVVLLPILIPLGICLAIWGKVITCLFWAVYCSRGINVLFVYSDSPSWKEYAENKMIPKLPQKTIKLNWSERKKWKKMTLPVLAFNHYGGGKEYNPLALILRPFRATKVYRFWKPFMDFKHGKVEDLEKLCEEFFSEVNTLK